MNIDTTKLKLTAFEAVVKGVVWGGGALLLWAVTVAITSDNRQKAAELLHQQEARDMQRQIQDFNEAAKVREINAKNEAVQREADILKRVAVLEAAPAVPVLPPPLPGVESTTQPRAALLPPLPPNAEVLVPEPGGAVVIVKPSPDRPSPREHERVHREVYVPPPPSPVQLPPSAARD